MANFDRLNNLESFSFEEYFEKMGISAEQKKKRVALAEALESTLLYIFAYALQMAGYGIVEAVLENELWEELEERMFLDLPDEVKYVPSGKAERAEDLEEDSEVRNHISVIAASIAATTVAHLAQEYFTSDERAASIAADEANGFYNYFDFREAAAQGKTRKRWNTMEDEKVRPAHAEADGQTVGIREYFIVGGEPMLYPRDLNGSPQNVIRCRCWATYL